MGNPLIFNIQKYSIHDGEGIRTTVFFKGCPIACKWCHNPESQSYKQEVIFQSSRCVGCGACAEVCPHHAITLDGESHTAATDREKCDLCATCLDYCLRNAREIAGREYGIKELVKELEKDRMFYEESGGGITLSGGEALAQDMDYVEQLMKALHARGYSVDVDTCGYVPYEHIRRALPYADTFLYDIKLMDAELHKQYVGVDNALILENLKRLSRDGGKINIRMPLIKGVNADADYSHIRKTIDFLRENRINVCRVNLLKYHNTGSGKYEKLGREYDGESMAPPEDGWMEGAKELFRRNGFTNIQIGG